MDSMPISMPAPNSGSEVLSTATDLPALSRPLNATEQELLAQLDRLKYFLATAPSRWSTAAASSSSSSSMNGSSPAAHQALNRFLLPSGEYVSCVLWAGLYHITGTDIVRALVFRFEAFGRPVVNMKKFEEGVFSDLRNLKPGTDACLEEPKSPFLDLLFKYQCIRTQKKQKVFYWFSVPHDRLFLDALERDLKREKMGLEATTHPRGEPALSFTYDPKRSLFEQFLQKASANGEDEDDVSQTPSTPTYGGHKGPLSVISPADILNRRAKEGFKIEETDSVPSSSSNPPTPFLSMFSLFEGSPTYKQRRKKTVAGPKRRSTLGLGSTANSFGVAREPMMHRPSQHAAHPSIQHQAHPAHPSIQHSAHQGQQLASYGLSMNPTVELPLRSAPVPPWTGGATPSPPGTATHPSLHSSAHAMNGASGHSTEAAPTSGTKKAYKCPLLTCRLIFRRPEHLKRHVRSHATTLGRKALESTLGHFVCDRPGCQKRFMRDENLQLHMSSCMGGAVGLGFASDLTEDGEDAGHMDFEVNQYEVVVDEHVPLEDDNASESVAPSPHPPSSAHGPRQLALYTDGVHQLAYAPPRSASATSASDGGYYSAVAPNNSNNPQFAHVITNSAESSPYVETPEGGQGQWAHVPRVPNQYSVQQKQHYNLSLGASGSAPPSSHGQSFHPQTRYESSEVNLYPPQHQQQPAAHPSSAPSHKATFDHGSLYPPTYGHHLHNVHSNGGMMGLSLRRHRSATPAIGGPRTGLDHVRAQFHSLSRPTSSAGVNNPAYGAIPGAAAAGGHPFAYSVDNVDGRNNYAQGGSDHSSPLSYGNVIQGEYDGTGGSPLGSAGAGSPGSAAGMGVSMVQQQTESQVMQQFVDLDQYVDNGEMGTYSGAPSTVYLGQHHPPASVSSYHEESPYMQSEVNANGSYHSASPDTTSPEEMEMYQYVKTGDSADVHHSATTGGHLQQQQQQYHPSHQAISLAPAHEQTMHLQYAYT